jgi:hypothetical protein
MFEWMQRKDPRRETKEDANNQWDGALRDSLVDVGAHSYNRELIRGVRKSERS